MKQRVYFGKIFLSVLVSGLFLSNAFAIGTPELNGKVFPFITADTLEGKKLQLPNDVKGNFTFVILGFSYKANKPSMEWFDEFEKRFSSNKSVKYFLVPMMGNNFAVKVMQSVITSGMKNGIPDKRHKKIATVFESLDIIKKEIHFNEKNDIYLFLLDEKGTIIWNETGIYTKEAFKNLDELIQ